MLHINPVEIEGRWRKGYALDRHVVSSEFIGYNEAGHPQFDTKRSEIGELLYRLKYQNDQSTISPLVEAAATYLAKWNPGVNALVPVTPSRQRKVQPIITLGAAVAEKLGIEFASDWISRTGTLPELKNIGHDERIRLLQGAHTVNKNKVERRKILILDDLFQTGATLNAIAAALYDQGSAAEVYALALTRAGRTQ
jgi:predicted amidophosphoribosyltransferase